VLTEPRGCHEVRYRPLTQAAKDLAREDGGIRAVVGPLPDRALVRGVLGAADLCGSPAMGWVSLFCPQLSENGVSHLTSTIAAPRDSLGSARFAVPAPPVAERRTAVGAAHGKRERRPRTSACLVPSCELVGPRGLGRLSRDSARLARP
jgi:hypothetical protein